MRRSDSRSAIGCLAAVLVLWCAAPVLASTGTLFIDQPCGDMTAIPAQYGVETSFVGITNCQNLCKQAVTICERAIRDAASCQLAFSNDWIAFDSKVACAGLTGGDLRDCKSSWTADKKSWQASIKQGRSIGVATCNQHLSACTFRCTGS